MNKLTFASVLLLSTAIFISCSPIMKQQSSSNDNAKEVHSFAITPYGAYLAGRVAHIRKDFDNASTYYKIAYQNNQDNPELINKLFLLLTSKGNIDEAVSYAKKTLQENSKNNFAHMVVALSQLKNQQFNESLKTIKNFNFMFRCTI